MIIGTWIVALVVGIGVGLVADELIRGRDRRSRYVIVAGVISGLGGLIAGRASGSHGLPLEALTALVGAVLVAFVTRVRISAAIAPAVGRQEVTQRVP